MQPHLGNRYRKMDTWPWPVTIPLDLLLLVSNVQHIADVPFLDLKWLMVLICLANHYKTLPMGR
jgi:hypothetical protein